MDDSEISGTIEPGYERVREAFKRNFEEELEVGAAVCVYVDGRRVVDLWGGHRDAAKTIPWTGDTLVNTWSSSKGWLATVMHVLLDRGLIDLEAPVAHYWPGFERHGKGGVQISHALTHTAGLPAITERVPDDDLYDFDRMLEYVADSELAWEPGTQMGYHSGTFGWINGGIVQKVSGMSPAEFLRTQIAEPLDADVHWAIPEEFDERTAEFIAPPSRGESPAERSLARGDLIKRVYNNPPRRWRDASTRRWRGAMIPSSNGQGSARGMSRLYAALSMGGAIDGVTLMSAESVDRARVERRNEPDVINGGPDSVRRSLGFALPGRNDPRSPNAFGHGGLGGSLGFADPDLRMSFGYMMNQASTGKESPRALRLAASVYECRKEWS